MRRMAAIYPMAGFEYAYAQRHSARRSGSWPVVLLLDYLLLRC